jgi:hypothetical protein
MTSSEWKRHKEAYCEGCKYNTKRKQCPAISWMDLDPNDVLCTQFIRGEHCTQWEPRPERPKKAKTERRGSEAR